MRLILEVLRYYLNRLIISNIQRKSPGAWFNIKTTSYQCKKSHCGDKTILRPSYLHNGIPYTGKMSSLYWIRAPRAISQEIPLPSIDSESRFKSIYSTMYRHQSYKSTEQCENKSNIFWWVHVWRPLLRPFGRYHKGSQSLIKYLENYLSKISFKRTKCHWIKKRSLSLKSVLAHMSHWTLCHPLWCLCFAVLQPVYDEYSDLDLRYNIEKQCRSKAEEYAGKVGCVIGEREQSFTEI